MPPVVQLIVMNLIKAREPKAKYKSGLHYQSFCDHSSNVAEP